MSKTSSLRDWCCYLLVQRKVAKAKFKHEVGNGTEGKRAHRHTHCIIMNTIKTWTKMRKRIKFKCEFCSIGVWVWNVNVCEWEFKSMQIAKPPKRKKNTFFLVTFQMPLNNSERNTLQRIYIKIIFLKSIHDAQVSVQRFRNNIGFPNKKWRK